LPWQHVASTSPLFGAHVFHLRDSSWGFRYPPHLSRSVSRGFAAGAGRYSEYTECCWTSTGTEQFRPSEPANPHIGTNGQLENVEEARVETICTGEEITRKVVQALNR